MLLSRCSGSLGIGIDRWRRGHGLGHRVIKACICVLVVYIIYICSAFEKARIF